MKGILLITLLLSVLEFAYAQVNEFVEQLNAFSKQWNNKIEFQETYYKKYFSRQDTLIKDINFIIDKTEHSSDSIYNFQILENGIYKFLQEDGTFYEIDTVNSKVYITPSIDRKMLKAIINSGINYSVIYYPLVIAVNSPFGISKDDSITFRIDSSGKKFDLVIDYKNVPELVAFVKEEYHLDSAKKNLGYELTAKMKNDAIQYDAYFIYNVRLVNNIKKAGDIINTFYPKYQIIQNKIKEKADTTNKSQISGEASEVIFKHFTLKETNGTFFSSKSIESKFLLIDFSYKNCLPCIKSIPIINKLTKQFNESNLNVLLIDPYDKANEIDDFRKTYNIHHKILIDEKRDVVKQFQVIGYPTFFLIDIKRKKIVARLDGYSEDFESMLVNILNTNIKR